MTDLVFVHGWGFDKTFWDNVIGELGNVRCHCLDLGFYGEPECELPDKAIYVTHSMGLCWLLERKADFTGLVSINGFTRFCATNDFVDGVHPRVLKRMVRQFTNKPATVWTDFMANSGLKEAQFPENADIAAMAEGLAYLESCDTRQIYNQLSCPKKALIGNSDLIVTQKMSEASFAEESICYKGGNHLLPLFQPKWVADQLRDFLDQIS